MGGEELASALSGTEHPLTVAIASERGLTVCTEFGPEDAHSGDWAFRSSFYAWWSIRGATVGTVAEATSFPRPVFSADWPPLKLEGASRRSAGVLKEFNDVCL
ncbi:MAG: hypothetical protein ACRDGJ_01635, partial [Candidatus Limnocylindria bacterium]